VKNNSYKRIKLPSDLLKVPKNIGGIYLFRLDFPTDYELGLSQSNNVDLNSVRTLLDKSIHAIIKVLYGTKLNGRLNNDAIGMHLRMEYEVNTNLREIFSADDCVNFLLTTNISIHDLMEISAVIRYFVQQTPPIYIGMSSKQSLYDRLMQHISSETNFAKQLLSYDLSWSDLQYSYIGLSNKESSRIRSLEKIVQFICKPTLSMH